MSMQISSSWTRYYLLDTDFLNKHCPLEANEKRLDVTGIDNLIDTLATDTLANHQVKVIHRPRATVLFRMAGIAKICLFYAPLGALSNGWKMLAARLSDNKGENAAKIEAYANGFWLDAKAFISGVIGILFLATPVTILTEFLLIPQLQTVAFAIAGIITSAGAIGPVVNKFAVLDPSARLAYLAGKDGQDRASLYLSLELRRKWGYVTESGGLLDTHGIDFEGTNEALMLSRVRGSSTVGSFIQRLDKDKHLSKLVKRLMQINSNGSSRIQFYIQAWAEAEYALGRHDNCLITLGRVLA